MTLLDAAWQKQGEDHPVLFTREIVIHKKEKAEPKISGIVAGRREGGREGKNMVCSCSFNKDLWGNVV